MGSCGGPHERERCRWTDCPCFRIERRIPLALEQSKLETIVRVIRRSHVNGVGPGLQG